MGIFVSVILFNAGWLQQYEHKQASFARPTYACFAGYSKSVLKTRLRFPFNLLLGVTRKSDQNTASRVSKMTSKISLHIIHIFLYSLS